MPDFITPETTQTSDYWIDQINVAVELPTGPPGDDGTIWLTGSGAPSMLPEDYTLYLDTDTGTVYAWNGEAWEEILNLNYDHSHGNIYVLTQSVNPQIVENQITLNGPVLLPDPETAPASESDAATIEARATVDVTVDPTSVNPIEAANKGYVDAYFRSFTPERALGSTDGTVSAATVGDSWDTTQAQGMYHQIGGGGLPPGVPDTMTTIGMVIAGEAGQCTQLVFSLGSGPTGSKWFTRSFNGSLWNPWQMLGYHISDGTPTPVDVMPAGALWIEY